MANEPPAGVDGEAGTGQYFARSPVVASDRRSVWLNLDGCTAELATDRGVFSAGAVDPGTRYLLGERPGRLSPGPDDHLLDLGCGYGPIAVALAAWTRPDDRRGPGPTVWAVDVNDRALELCRTNVAAAGLDERVRVLRPEEVPPEVRFTEIWSNPPIRIGKEALHRLLTTWLDRLTGDGVAWLVVHRHLGADSLQDWLSAEGHPTRRRSSRAGYRLLQVAAA